MTKATEIRPSTSIAATSWQAQDGTHIRIYAQYNDGGIRESRWDAQTGWTGGKSKDTIIETTYNNTVLAVANRDNGKLIHVYYTWTEFISGDTFLGEICKDGEGPWYPGALNKAGIKLASNSGLAACADAMGDRDITVLYFRPDYTMFEAVWNKSVWVQRSVTDDAGQAIKNSKSYLGLSAVTSRRPPGNIIQAYCMAADGDIGEFCTTQNGTWFIRNVSVNDQLAGGDQTRGVTAYIEQGSVNTRVYYMTSGHSEVMERIRTYSTGNTPSWANISSVDGCHPSAGVAVVGASGQEPIRLYSQDVHTNRVQELGWVTEDTEWRVLGYVPTGKVE